MNITTQNVDELNAVLKIKIEKQDYEEKVNEVLGDYRKKARVDGFRPGKVPSGLIKKMYGKPVLAEQVNRIVSETLYNHIRENDMKILGEPLPSEKEQTLVDFDNSEEYEFAFDIGLSPEIEVNISQKDKIPFYSIKTDKKEIDKYIDNLASQYGELKDTDVIEEKEMVKGDVKELDENGNLKEEGIQAEETMISFEIIKDDKIKKSFEGKKVGDTISFNIRKAYPNDQEIAGILKLENKEMAAEINGDFEFTIKEIKKYEKAEVNQDFYNKLFGEGNVNSEEEFREKIKEELEKQNERACYQQFGTDAKNYLLKKYKFDLPVEFLKRYLLAINEGKYEKDQIDEEYPKFEDDIKWQLIRDKIFKKFDMKIEEQEIMAYAQQMARYQFYQYGMYDVPEEHLDNYAKQMLENREERNRITDNISQEKVIQHVRENVKLDEKSISREKFDKLNEK